MNNHLMQLKPERVWHYFEQISNIPRCSKKEQKISDYIYQWAKSNHLKAFQDAHLNVVIYKNAAKGYENAPTVILQGHMDMVCEKNNDVDHDFDHDPLKLIVKDDYICADRTTLGADNGIAVAMMMALLEADDISHPALEILITSDEETGMTGVINLDTSKLEGRILINLDSEGEGVFTAGSSGGARVQFRSHIQKTKGQKNKTCKITVNHLKGGHSGADIHLDRANANKLLGRILDKIKDDIELCDIGGGAADNAIPREAYAVIKTNDIENIKEIVLSLETDIKDEFKFSDPDVRVLIDEIEEQSEWVLTLESFEQVIDLINLIPYGPLKINHLIDLVILSHNLGVIKIVNDEILMTGSVRSPIKSLLEGFFDQMEILSKRLHVNFSTSHIYPGWDYATSSTIRDICVKTYIDLFGEEPKVIALHAGLECGFLIEKMPGLDAISFGPNMHDIHTPDERLSISSTERTYNFLKEILKNAR
jgi:dipeptidase D